MRKMTALLTVLALAALAAGCTNSSPMSNSKPTVGLYSQTFDGAGYVISSEWASTAGLGLTLDNTVSASAPYSLKITNTSATIDAAVYTVPGLVPAYSAGDLFNEVRLSLNGVASTSTKVEFVAYRSNSVTALVGFDPSNGTLYTPLSYTTKVLKTGVTAVGHYLLMVTHVDGTTDYWDNGALMSSNVATSASRPISGGPSNGVAIFLPSALAGADLVRIDNVAVYHY